MNLNFTKMQGLGNDFILIPMLEKDINLTKNQIQFLCNRRFGIGCDQLLLVTKTSVGGYQYRIFNTDGSEAEQCGNGVRCVALYLREQGLWNSESIQLKCLAGMMDVHFIKDKLFCVSMGVPQSINFIDDVTFVSMGNPHLISFMPSIKNLDLETETKKIKEKLKITEGINISFVNRISPQTLEARVFERGAGETLACGSAACAIVAAGQALKLLEKKVEVILPGGILTIEKKGEALFMTGPAERVFDGNIIVSF